MNFFASSIPNIISTLQIHNNLKIYLLLLLILSASCSTSKRIFINDYDDIGESNIVRVLIGSNMDEQIISVDDQLLFSDNNKTIAKIKKGNKIRISKNFGRLSISISDKVFESDEFFLDPLPENEILKIDGKKYRGRIKIFYADFHIEIINQIRLEDYVKGVMIKEMPLGNGSENYEALKAFSICARTYAVQKLIENKETFDIYPDTRDQVYGGVDGETEITNKIVDETNGQLLYFDDEPAVIFYHSTCGGKTENVKNVFTKRDLSYLSGVEDGSEPFCKISPRYEWSENYTETNFIDRLYQAKLINTINFNILHVKINSLFESSRVKELEIMLENINGAQKSVNLIGNGLRSIIKTSDGQSILRSTLFDISVDSLKNITINGKGSGHGVGLCQWGAIGQSRNGIDYKNILSHYFPGTKIKNLYD